MREWGEADVGGKEREEKPGGVGAGGGGAEPLPGGSLFLQGRGQDKKEMRQAVGRREASGASG
jgi:hypothetical protein